MYSVLSKPPPVRPVSIDDDPRMAYAIARIFADYGDRVSVASKKKDLIKFGRTSAATSGNKTTLATFGTGILNETFVTTNLIDSLSSSSASDTSAKSMTVEGHTIDGSGNLTFVTQTRTLNGQSEVTLSTPLARCTRIYQNGNTFASPATALVGTVYAYDNTGVTLSGGVPNVAASIKCVISAGRTQSGKCATSISQSDYWIITGTSFGVERATGSAISGDFEIERRDVKNGGVWVPLGLVGNLRSNAEPFAAVVPLAEYFIIPKNHDMRMVVTPDGNCSASATVYGVLAGVL